MKTILRSLSAGLIYPFTFLIFMASIGTDVHYVLPYFMLSALTIVIVTKLTLKTYNEMNLIWGGILIYLTFFVGVFVKDLGNIWLIAGASIGSSLIFQTILYKYKKNVVYTFGAFIVGSIISITQIEYFINNSNHILYAEILIVVLFFILLWMEPKSFIRFFIYFVNNIRHPLIVKGRENLPKEEDFILVSNHPTYYDELIIESILPYNLKVDGVEKSYPEKIKNWIKWGLEYNNKEKTISLFFPEKEMSFNSLFSNFDLEKILMRNNSIYVIPMVIKDIKERYNFIDNDTFTLRSKKYFKPIEIVFGQPIKISTQEDIDELKKIMLKMGENLI